jgi:uncharacterized protein YerC
MAKRSAQSIAPELEKKLHTSFYQVLGDLASREDAERFAKQFFSEAEVSMFTKRLGVALLLKQGKSYDQIQKALNVSTATISVVADGLHKAGYHVAIEKLEIESWAELWSTRLYRLFGGK